MTSYNRKRSYGGSYSSSSVKRRNTSTNRRATVQPFVYNKNKVYTTEYFDNDGTFDCWDDEDNVGSRIEKGGRSAFQEVTYTLSKEDKSTKETPPPVYSIFSSNPKNTASKDSSSTHPKFDEMYRNAFKGKRNIHLYIANQQVIWEFRYNATIVAAVKAYVPNRSYNPTTKSWTCPLEDLPEAIELYEFMGRKPDAALQKRSQQIRRARLKQEGSDGPKDHITLAVRCGRTGSDNDDDDWGSSLSVLLEAKVYVAFRFDAQIISAIKLLPPTQRHWDPATREWSLELQVLPDLLDHLVPLGYDMTGELTALCQACRDVSKHLKDVSQLEEEYNNNQKHEVIVVQEELDDSFDAKMAKTQASLKEALQKTQDLLEAQQKSQPEPQSNDIIDRGDCGYSKRSERTLAQEVWSLQQQEGISADNSYMDLYCKVLRKRQPPKEQRYYGSFVCRGCQNKWTSAYTWKGEQQDCRRCDLPNEPVSMEDLQPGLGRVRDDDYDRGGEHDQARCSKCQSLGYACFGISYEYN